MIAYTEFVSRQGICLNYKNCIVRADAIGAQIQYIIMLMDGKEGYSECFENFHDVFVEITKGFVYKPIYYTIGVYYFSYFAPKIDYGYSLEPPLQGGSNVYPQSLDCGYKFKPSCRSGTNEDRPTVYVSEQK